MALAAMIALLHDLVITAGIYSLVGFEVTPATVIGFLTILGYSLYDTVVVFDKVRENTAGLAGGSRMTYSEAANLAVNQTLVRSINTSIIALLPVAAILFVGVVLLGAGTLKDLALALFVGVAVGAYSSIFIATPMLAQLKEREPGMQALAKRVAARAGGGGKAPARGTADLASRGGRRDGATRSPRPACAAASPQPPSPIRDTAAAGPAPGAAAAQPAAQGQAAGPAARSAGDAQARSRDEAATPVAERLDAPALLLARIRDVPDFPEPGIVFKDITPLLADHGAFAAVVDALVDAIAGPRHDRQGRRHRGPRVHPRRAGGRTTLGAGFVPVRKQGKLPGATLEASLCAGVRRGDDRGRTGRVRAGRPGAGRRRRAGHRRHGRGDGRPGAPRGRRGGRRRRCCWSWPSCPAARALDGDGSPTCTPCSRSEPC